MKATGIVRRVDDLGRIVLPKELRRYLMINEADPLEIYVDGDMIILKKYAPGCMICGETTDDAIEVNGNTICMKCARSISSLAVGEG
jgi:transcriptional pleiotropic regulator of transition state genes